MNNTPYTSNCLFKTPSAHLFHTPLNQLRRLHTPHSSLRQPPSSLAAHANATTASVENPCESLHEQMTPEYCLEAVWAEAAEAGSERAAKFFRATDLYGQRYVCYLLPAKAQLRCLRVESEVGHKLTWTPSGG